MKISATNRAVFFATVIYASPGFAFFGSPGPDVVIAESISTPAANTWLYTYALTNNTKCFGNCGDTVGGKSITSYVLSVRQFALPYFTDSTTSSIVTPMNWTAEISNIDIFALGSNAGAILWTATSDTSGIALGISLTGFGFTSSIAPGESPASIKLGDSSSQSSISAIPLSQFAIQAGITPISTVPEPSAYIFLLGGMAGLLLLNKGRIIRGLAEPCKKPSPPTGSRVSPTAA